MTVTGYFSAILIIHEGFTVSTSIEDGVEGPEGGEEAVKKCVPLHSIVSPVMIIKLYVVCIEALNEYMEECVLEQKVADTEHGKE